MVHITVLAMETAVQVEAVLVAITTVVTIIMGAMVQLIQVVAEELVTHLVVQVAPAS